MEALLAALALVALVWVPGALARRAVGVAGDAWGCGRFAVEAALSLGLWSVVLFPLALFGVPLLAAAPLAALVLFALAVAAWRRRGGASPVASRGPGDGAPFAECAAFALAVALVLPGFLFDPGAKVDDWWDLSLVSAWLARGHFGFAQGMLAPDADAGVHPRFLWSVWLVLQAIVSSATGVEAWRVQQGPLPALVGVLVVSAQAALARGLRLPTRAVVAVVLAAAAWMWATEAIPLFLRGYQDKFVAAFVVAPVLLALWLRALLATREPGGGRRDDASTAVVLGLVALGAASVHSLVFTMALFVAGATTLAVSGRDAIAWARQHPRWIAAVALPVAYPLVQAALLAVTFGDQGIHLSRVDNPVVRAHLALERLVAPQSWAMVVHPGAVFGPVALLALPGLALAWRRRREARSRALLAMTLAPCALLFVPGLAGLAGRLWVPWMLYRLGWMVPVALLIGLTFARLSEFGRRRPDAAPRPLARRLVAAAYAGTVLLVAVTTGADRLRRDLAEHPAPPPSAPQASALVVLRHLAAQEGRDAVMAPANFAELVPAIAGKPVVALTERGTLVWSPNEEAAYERLRDRAAFFSTATPPDERGRIAQRRQVRWAVLPRRLVASGSEGAWLRRYGSEATLAASRFDREAAGERHPWWASTPAAALAGLGGSWSVALETPDHVVMERRLEAVPGRDGLLVEHGDLRDSPATPHAASMSRRAGSAGIATQPAWKRPFAPRTSRAPTLPGTLRLDRLARASGAPGAVVEYAGMPPRVAVPAVMPVWLDGPAPWEDAPSEVSVTLDLGARCRIEVLRLIPHLPRLRREIFEIRVGDLHEVHVAVHGEPIDLVLSDPSPRRRVTAGIRSLLGSPPSLSDVQALGPREDCEAAWPVHAASRTPSMHPSPAGILSTAAIHRDSGRPLVALARRAATEGRDPARVALLREATRREPSLVEAWVELGFAFEAAGSRQEAMSAFGSALVVDSRSAWAHGAMAWAQRSRGNVARAIWHALRATVHDGFYADAWTILGAALSDWRLDALAARALEVAEHKDARRNWPALVRADIAARRGDLAAARAALRTFLEREPYDADVRARLATLSSARSAPGSEAGAATADGPP